MPITRHYLKIVILIPTGGALGLNASVTVGLLIRKGLNRPAYLAGEALIDQHISNTGTRFLRQKNSFLLRDF